MIPVYTATALKLGMCLDMRCHSLGGNVLCWNNGLNVTEARLVRHSGSSLISTISLRVISTIVWYPSNHAQETTENLTTSVLNRAPHIRDFRHTGLDCQWGAWYKVEREEYLS